MYEFDDADIAERKETATTLDSNVAYAEPNFVVEGEALPLDSYFSTDQKVMWNGLTRYEPLISANVQEDMGFNHAWDTTKGDTDTIIAVHRFWYKHFTSGASRESGCKL